MLWKISKIIKLKSKMLSLKIPKVKLNWESLILKPISISRKGIIDVVEYNQMKWQMECYILWLIIKIY